MVIRSEFLKLFDNIFCLLCFSICKVAAHLRSFFEKVGSFARLFIVYICAHTFSR